MAITEWYPPTVDDPDAPWLDRARAWYYAWRVGRDIAWAKQRMTRIATKEQAQELKRARLQERERKRANAIKNSSLRREMRRTEKAIGVRLTALEFAHWSKSDRRGRYRVSRIRFAQRVATPARVFLRVDTARLPRGRGITTQNLMEQEVLDELSLACHAPVTYERHYERGFWFIVDLGGKLSAIPSIVERREVIEQMPIGAGVLDVPFGIGNYRRFYHVNLEDAPHMIVAGATGFGKSVFIHNIVTYILENTKPEQVRLALADLKGGAELGRYGEVPHLWQAGGAIHIDQRVYTKRDEVIEMLKAVLYEVERRLQLFAEEHVSKLSSWNQKHHNRAFPRLLVIVDEIQNAMLDSRTRGEMESTLVDIASRARATGVHLVIATQRPSVDVITGLIKANFPSRVAFNCFSIHDSRTILDTTEAANLGRPGLLVFRGMGNTAFRCQSPWLTEGLIEEIITRSVAGEMGTVKTRSVGLPDLLTWAVAKNQGKFTIDEVYHTFRPQGVTYQEVSDVWARFSVKGAVMECGDKHYVFRKRDSTLIESDAQGNPVGQLTIEDMVRWSLREKSGAFAYRELYKAFRTDLSDKRAKQVCSEWLGKTVMIDGVEYRLDPGNGGNKPKQWVRTE